MKWIIVFLLCCGIIGLVYQADPEGYWQSVEIGGWIVLAVSAIVFVLLIRGLLQAGREWTGPRPDMSKYNPRSDGLTESPEWYDRERARKQRLVDDIHDWRIARRDAVNEGRTPPPPPQAPD